MNRHLIWALAFALSVFGTSSFAATQTFWAYGNGDGVANDSPKFLNNSSKNIAISYSLGSTTRIVQAFLAMTAQVTVKMLPNKRKLLTSKAIPAFLHQPKSVNTAGTTLTSMSNNIC